GRRSRGSTNPWGTFLPRPGRPRPTRLGPGMRPTTPPPATDDPPGNPLRRVVVVAGETGSGKTTQLPKICLELGRGQAGLIGHTQPRRIAARTVAERIAEELGSE